jgi:hypothetical protein
MNPSAGSFTPILQGETHIIEYPNSDCFKYTASNGQPSWLLLDQQGSPDYNFELSFRGGNFVCDFGGDNELFFSGTVGESLFVSKNIIHPFYVTYTGSGSALFDIDFYSWDQTYIDLANAFDATLSDAPEGVAHLKEAMLVVINIIATGLGTEAATLFLKDMDLLYRSAKRHYSYRALIVKMVKNINKFTIKHFGDLDIFVNSLLWSDDVSVANGCVPLYWAELSAEGNTNTSNWIVCS